MGADKATFWQGFLRNRAANLPKKRMKKKANVGIVLKSRKQKVTLFKILAFKKEHCMYRINIRSKIIKVQLGSMRTAVYSQL
jgi:hypothetical protein